MARKKERECVLVYPQEPYTVYKCEECEFYGIPRQHEIDSLPDIFPKKLVAGVDAVCTHNNFTKCRIIPDPEVIPKWCPCREKK